MYSGKNVYHFIEIHIPANDVRIKILSIVGSVSVIEGTNGL
jgi:hypothetical protein